MSALAWFKEKINWLRNQIYQKASFLWLAEISTSRAPRYFGMIPTLGTLFMLLLASLSMAGTIWLGTALWAGAFAKAAAFFPILSETVAWVLGSTLVTFWFSRDINRALFSTRDDRDIFVYSQKVNPTKLYQLVEHLTHEVNAHFAKIYGDKHKPIPVPSIFTHTLDEIDITSFGRNPGKTSLFISTGTFNYTKNNLNQRKLAALIEKELVKIYLNRGVYRTIVSMGTTLANTLNMFSNSDVLLLRAIGILTGPIQYALLLEKSINRSFEYEAAGHVINCGRGLDLYAALDCGVNPNLETTPPYSEIKANQTARQRRPYNGMFSSVLKPLTDWVERNEVAEYDKTGSLFLSFWDICVGEFLFYIRELYKPKPRATNEKAEVRKAVKSQLASGDVTLGVATAEQLRQMDLDHRQKNEVLYRQIPQNNRYDVIGPNGSGYVSPIIDAQERPINQDRDVFFVPARGVLTQRQARRAQERQAPLPARQQKAHGMTLRKRAASTH
ncbi:MAG: hypothetical protein JSR17_08715 [Proteobacteria bacterium]|nr:hypothetical protein [Pseudomonadota bacterium]